ncbi:hypothetical protein [Oryza sativa Japonica Group]|uniref:Uncharacterized protein n=1 Tax=Oryza sativa subsp. japonica TaxID=39947 RepID=Q9ASL4_ORYSJ|nr:hypothetical protein [Oryza sativa Japonica Group]BAB55783.1 hypothetical protein [Oryza sativa Japonica Group]
MSDSKASDAPRATRHRRDPPSPESPCTSAYAATAYRAAAATTEEVTAWTRRLPPPLGTAFSFAEDRMSMLRPLSSSATPVTTDVSPTHRGTASQPPPLLCARSRNQVRAQLPLPVASPPLAPLDLVTGTPDPAQPLCHAGISAGKPYHHLPRSRSERRRLARRRQGGPVVRLRKSTIFAVVQL